MRLNYAAATHKGLQRSNNQDAYLCRPDKGLFAVADGLGGHQGGEVASQLAVRVLENSALTRPDYNSRLVWWQPGPKPVPDGLTTRKWLGAIFEQAGRAIKECARARPELAGLGSTMTVLALEGRSALVAHLGDSRAYLMRRGALYQLSRDHSLAEELLNEGLVSATEISRLSQASVLTKALCDSTTAAFAPDVSRHAFLPEDTFLLCSDGLYGPLGEALIHEIMTRFTNLQEAARNLIKTANALGGPDNITAVLIHIEH